MNKYLIFSLLLAALCLSTTFYHEKAHGDEEILSADIDFSSTKAFSIAKITVTKSPDITEKISFHPILKKDILLNPHFSFINGMMHFLCNPKKLNSHRDPKMGIKFLKNKTIFYFRFTPEEGCTFTKLFYLGKYTYELSVPLTTENIQQSRPEYRLRKIGGSRF